MDPGSFRRTASAVHFTALPDAGKLVKSGSTTTLALAVISTIALGASARIEERADVARFGDEYREYMRRTRRFVPFAV